MVDLESGEELVLCGVPNRRFSRICLASRSEIVLKTGPRRFSVVNWLSSDDLLMYSPSQGYGRIGKKIATVGRERP